MLRQARTDFSDLFDRAAAACAQSQRVVNQSAAAQRRARASRVASMRLRRKAIELHRLWVDADALHSVLRTEVEHVARLLRASGVDDRSAVATVRARIRFVLYDGGLTEQDAEPVVQRASLWVERVYAA